MFEVTSDQFIWKILLYLSDSPFSFSPPYHKEDLGIIYICTSPKTIKSGTLQSRLETGSQGYVKNEA